MHNRVSNSSKIITRTLVISCILVGFFTFSLDYIFYTPKITPNVIYAKPFVNSIEFTEPPITGNKITVIVKGGLPTPCWKMDGHEIQTETSVNFINITLWAYIPKDIICIQLAWYFVYELKLRFPVSGNWTIQCNQFSRNIMVFD